MKNRFLHYVFISGTLLVASVFTPCFGQLTVKDVQEIAPSGVQPLLSPNGEYVLVRDANGLNRIDATTGERAVLLPETDIDDITFSDGGTMIAFRTIEYQGTARYNTIKAADLKTGTVKVLDKPSRERYAFRFAGGKMKIAKQTTIRTQRLLTDVRKVEHEYVLAVEDDDLIIYDGKIRKVLNPNGKNIYLWQSLSPDETKIVYVAINNGCHAFVCNTDGTNLIDLGHYIGAPTWLNDNWIIGQQDEDDGHQMTASRLVAIHPDGSGFQTLATPEQAFPINPSASRNGKVVFENEGKIYLMNLENK